MVNAITKSGTNTFTGTTYGFFRDDRFNATDFIAKRVLPYSNQQAGATFGGPIQKDKLHFFGYSKASASRIAFRISNPAFLGNVPDVPSFAKKSQMAGGASMSN
jgi:hypothetical protein